MPKAEQLEMEIFNIKNEMDFNKIAVKIFHFQYQSNAIYRNYVDNINRDIKSVEHYTQIPFLPIEFFKSHTVISGEFIPERVFTSSGTTGNDISKHFVKKLKLYEKSFSESFRHFMGLPESYVIIGLLPSYLEREGSSLIYMTDRLIKMSSNKASGFYLNDYEQLSELLYNLADKNKKTLLLGVTFALLELADKFPVKFPGLKIMETGGMKGRRKEIVREELHKILQQAFGVDKIYSEYGMTELLSQAYSLGGGIFSAPPWMKILIRDTDDPFTYINYGKTGGINIIDLANVYSCSFIETKDLGKLLPNGDFEVHGRFDNSDVRGCNLLVV